MTYRDYDRGYRGGAGDRDFDRDYDRDYERESGRDLERGQERGAYGREGGFREGGYGAREGWRGESERGGFGRGERDWSGTERYRGGRGYGGSEFGRSAYGGGWYGGGAYGGGAYRGGGYGGAGYGSDPYDASPYGPSYGRSGARSFGRTSGFESDEYGYGTRDRESWLGRHAGRGPKGYRRSDDRIREDVNDRLTAHPDIDATEIEVRVQNGEVTLTGVVEDRRTKRMAEDAIEDVIGVDDVHNQLKVRHGFLAGLTGEKADEREVSRPPVREGAQRSPGTTGPSTTTGAGTTARG